MINKLFLIFACCGYTSSTLATIFIEVDLEGGEIPYVGSKNAHPGGGYISFLGGEVTNVDNPGDGTQDYLKYTNVILDNNPDAKNATSGSNYSLKTQYKVGSERSFQKNTTIIKFPETYNVYIRWYQKWSKSWVWPTSQQKLLKIKGPSGAQSFRPSFGNNYLNVVKLSPPPKANQSQTYVYSDWKKPETDFRLNDSISGNSNYKLDTNRWYCIETMVKSSTLANSKGEYAYWINDDLKLHLKNTYNFVKGADPKKPNYRGMTSVEMQHVMEQTGGANITVDMPTWMDNIVVSDQRIGCSGKPIAAPKPPSGLSDL
ncbi:hypothetical protein MNBD_GAMMA06-595 [hydrothermal vent metagenome]|uniref:Uncharacterized protein n=1 Tax=hydrothermal vent metagenome TaxID=652676 RepID=A0A3B0WFZ9_9ZZZZ